MTTQSLDDFFREKRAHVGPGAINWEQKKTDWIVEIEHLYEEIKRLLHSPITNGSVSVDFRPKTITEDFIGTHSVRELVLRVGDGYWCSLHQYPAMRLLYSPPRDETSSVLRAGSISWARWGRPRSCLSPARGGLSSPNEFPSSSWCRSNKKRFLRHSAV
jgi:hypothetical protein